MSPSSLSSAPPSWRPSFFQGQQVIITQGTFAGMEGQVTGAPGPSGQVPVTLRLYARPVPIEMEPWLIAPQREMTETEWLTCTAAPTMAWCLHAQGRPSARQMRLFACACIRWLALALADERYRRAVDASERFADGRASATELETARSQVTHALWGTERPSAYVRRVGVEAFGRRRLSAAENFLTIAQSDAGAVFEAALQSPWMSDEERRWQADLLRDVIGNPFRRVSIAPTCRRWNDGCVVKMARTIYEGRRFEELPILADALEEAGCDSTDLLAHCRSETEHVRGCWALDLLLEKS